MEYLSHSRSLSSALVHSHPFSPFFPLRHLASFASVARFSSTRIRHFPLFVASHFPITIALLFVYVYRTAYTYWCHHVCTKSKCVYLICKCANKKYLLMKQHAKRLHKQFLFMCLAHERWMCEWTLLEIQSEEVSTSEGHSIFLSFFRLPLFLFLSVCCCQSHMVAMMLGSV